MKNNDYVKVFAEHLAEEDKSNLTISSYLTDVKGFLKFIKKDIKKLKKDDVNSYKEDLRKRHLTTKTINRKLVGVKQFIEFLNDKYELGIAARIKQEKVQEQYSLKDEDLLTKADYNRLIEAVESAGDIRAKALFETMYYSGMRISEALQLRVDHVQKGLKVIEDIKGKGSKYRPIFITSKLQESLKAYLEVRKQPERPDLPKNSPEHTKALFVGQKGPLTRETAHKMIKKYAKLAGIESSRAHVHNLRHLFGLQLAEKEKPIQDIAKYLGHSNMETTRVYVEKTISQYADALEQSL